MPQYVTSMQYASIFYINVNCLNMLGSWFSWTTDSQQ